MMVNCDKRIVCYTPFKNYSCSIHHYLYSGCRYGDVWWRTMGPQPFDRCVGSHTNLIADDWSDYGKWLPIRNPYHRVLSMWGYMCRVDKPFPFEEFIENCLRERHLGPVIELYPDHTNLLPVEDMPIAFHELGFNYGVMPHANAGAYSHVLTKHQRQAIADRHQADFIAGRYEM